MKWWRLKPAMKKVGLAAGAIATVLSAIDGDLFTRKGLTLAGLILLSHLLPLAVDTPREPWPPGRLEAERARRRSTTRSNPLLRLALRLAR